MSVLPLELLIREGAGTYLRRLGEITGLEISQAEVESYVARNASPRHDIVMTPEQREIIYRRSAAGNAYVAQRFDLPLAEYGYPLPQS